MKKILQILILAIIVATFFLVSDYKMKPTITIHSDTIRISDTVIVHDTIHIDKPIPQYVAVVRRDTIAVIDTIVVAVPIEQKTYQTTDYKAVIEGYKANLKSLDIYRENKYIYDTIIINTLTTITKTKQPRFALSLGSGIGYDGKRFAPYIGVNVGWVIWSK